MLLETKFIKRAVCQCGFSILRDEISLGSVYRVDPVRAEVGFLICGGCGRRTGNIQIVWAESVRTGYVGFLPLEIFDIAKVN